MAPNRLQLIGVENGTVDAETDVTRARRNDAAKARSVPARHSRLERELSRQLVFGAQRPDSLEHRRRAARIHLDVLLRMPRQELSHEPVMADAAIVGCEFRIAQQSGARRVRSVSKAEQHPLVRTGSAQLVLPDRQWSDTDAAPHEERPARFARRLKRRSERAEDIQLLGRGELGQPPRPRSDVLQ